MKRHGLFLLAVASFVVEAGVLTAGDDAKEEAIKKDRKLMAGTWRVISYQKDGKKAPAEQLAKTRSIISADGKTAVKREGKTIIQVNFKIDPTKKPKQSEATYTEGELKGKTVLGIYEVDGDNMIICYALPGKDRPSEFSSKPASSHVLITYKRVVQAQKKAPPKNFTNSIGMKFVWIPPGSFMMGSTKKEMERQPFDILGFRPDETQHKVTLTKGFYMGVYTVTQEQWQAVMGNNPSYFKGKKNLPVERVSWDNCQKFIKKLRGKDKRPYRLPTEAEWEYACRAGTTTPFYFGETISTDQANYDGNFTYGKGKKGVDRGKTTPVGSFPANAWGLYDMHGNVWQWCQDWLGDYPHKEVVDPHGPTTGETRVMRGGSFSQKPGDCRSAKRNGGTLPSQGDAINIGFRLCFSVE